MSSPEENNPKSPSPSTQWDQISEQQLDEALSRASALAGNLAREVSDADSLKADIDHAKSIHPREPDTELEQLDKLLAETNRQLAHAEPSVENASARTSTEPAESENSIRPGRPVPDFMSEFTQPEGPISQHPSLPEFPASPLQGKSQAATTAAGTTAIATPEQAVRKTAAGVSTIEDEMNSPSQTPQSATLTASPKAQFIVDHLSPVASKLCEPAIRALETFDKPFARINPKVKSISGWIAMVLLAVSVIVLLFARR